MKALHVSLASRPYRDNRAFLLTAAVLGGLVLLLTLNNVWTAVDYLSNTENVRTDIARLETEIADTRSEAARLNAEIEKIDRRELNRRIEYVNTQIAERAFSWNRLLNDLERVMPDDVRVTQLNPSVEGATVQLAMSVESKTQDGVIRLLDQMLADPSFARAFPRSEQLGEDGIRRFVVEAEYRGEGVALR